MAAKVGGNAKPLVVSHEEEAPAAVKGHSRNPRSRQAERSSLASSPRETDETSQSQQPEKVNDKSSKDKNTDDTNKPSGNIISRCCGSIYNAVKSVFSSIWGALTWIVSKVTCGYCCAGDAKAEETNPKTGEGSSKKETETETEASKAK